VLDVLEVGDLAQLVPAAPAFGPAGTTLVAALIWCAVFETGALPLIATCFVAFEAGPISGGVPALGRRESVVAGVVAMGGVELTNAAAIAASRVARTGAVAPVVGAGTSCYGATKAGGCAAGYRGLDGRYERPAGSTSSGTAGTTGSQHRRDGGTDVDDLSHAGRLDDAPTPVVARRALALLY
jgi:hypothetical protein